MKMIELVASVPPRYDAGVLTNKNMACPPAGMRRRAMRMIFAQSGLLLALSMTQGMTAQTSGTFALAGLTSPATVSESIFVYAAALPPTTTNVTYLIDNQAASSVSKPPFWIGGVVAGGPAGFSVKTLLPGMHQLRAVAKLSNGQALSSNVVTLDVLGSMNAQLSSGLTAYPNELSAQLNTLQQILAETTTPNTVLSTQEIATRVNVLQMYMNWGIDASLDHEQDQSQVLLGLSPKGWAPAHMPVAGVPLSMLFSPDAPFYHAIPAQWPRVALPASYIQKVQLNTNQQGDGLGFGEVVASPSDPELVVRSQWYNNVLTLRLFPFQMPRSWTQALPSQSNGDMHMIFVSPQQNAFVSSYKTSLDPITHGPDALYAAPASALGTLGDRGGSTAAGFAELPVLIQPGEATNPQQKIPHAIGGSVGRTWAARVYPASSWDTGVKTSVNSCTGAGFTNSGLVPYGAVIQLDPKVQVEKLSVSLPARRILEAIQTYGYYVMDFGCTDLDIYTAIPETELDPYGGLWGYNKMGPGVQNEVQNVLASSTLYVVVPLTKKQ